MTISQSDFFRLLPKALAGRDYTVNNDKVLCKLNEGHVEINLVSGDARKIGPVELPVNHVKFIFENSNDKVIEDFFSKFDLSYHKGGG